MVLHEHRNLRWSYSCLLTHGDRFADLLLCGALLCDNEKHLLDFQRRKSNHYLKKHRLQAIENLLFVRDLQHR